MEKGILFFYAVIRNFDVKNSNKKNYIKTAIFNQIT